MKQRFSLFFVLTLCCLVAWAGPVGLESARGKAAKFMFEHNSGARLASDSPVYAPARKARGAQQAVSDAPAYYVFNTEYNSGYVVVSGDDRTDDILAYSTTGSFDEENMPENVRAWMQGYAEQIAMLDGYVQQPTQQTRTSAQWEAVAPLVTTKWNQGAPYNNECPLHNGERSVTGCSATAMAQVMNYHQWPQDSVASIAGYTSSSTKVYASKLPSTAFRWDEMKDTYGSKDDGSAVAELMRYCAQAIKSEFSRLATGAYTEDVATALRKTFKYEASVEMRKIDYYTISDWEEIVYNELKENRPVYHAGYSLEGGHAFVCDGYDGNGMFHFNWGWGGSHDGYFKLALMNPGTGGIGSGSADGYSAGQEVIIGIQPPTEKKVNRYFIPNSEQYIGNVIYSYFMNPYAESVTANVGFGLVDENGEFVRILRDCGQMTLKANYGDNKYIGLNFDTELSLSPGKYLIATVCRAKSSTKWVRVGGKTKYFEVDIAANGSVEKITVHPVKQYSVLGAEPASNMIASSEQKVKITIQNQADELTGIMYLFASKTTEKGTFQSYAPLLMKENETNDYYLVFTPESAGRYNIWFSENPDGSNPVYQTEVTVNEAPKKPASLQLTKCPIDKDELIAKPTIRNLSDEPYCREIVAILMENLYDDGYLYGTEMIQEQGDIEPNVRKEFVFDFKSAKSNNKCAIFIGYYKKHTDKDYVQLGGYQHFTSGETPVESVEEDNVLEGGALYRLDGTKMEMPEKGIIYIKNGKKYILK